MEGATVLSTTKHIVADPFWIGVVSFLVGVVVVIATSYIKLLIDRIKEDQINIVSSTHLAIDTIKEHILLLIKTIQEQTEANSLSIRKDIERLEKNCEKKHERTYRKIK